MNRLIERRSVAALRPHRRRFKLFGEPTTAEIEDLAVSMTWNGLLCPVEVTEEGAIICGHMRVMAAKKIGWTKIHCWVRWDLTTKAEVEQRLIEDNLQRRQLDELTVVRCYWRLKELQRVLERRRPPGDLRDVLAQRFSLSGQMLDRHALLLDAPLPIQKAVSARQLTLAIAIRLLSLPQMNLAACVARIEAGDDPRTVAKASLGR